jgi:hypothetical protein
MNFNNPYSREAYKEFFQNQFLTDDFKISEEKLSFEFTPQYLKSAFVIGEDKSLELKVLEVLHDSENDPRLGLSKDIFRLMSSYGYKRALVLLHSSKSKNYRLSLATIELSLEGSKIKKEYSNPRRYSFFLGPDAKVKTPHNFLISKGRVKDFEDLLSRFSVEVVTKQFYQEIANWYFWALKNVKFPDDAEAEDNGRNIAAIRLITRLIFIWFMKVRKLVPDELFDEENLKSILKKFDLKKDNYYKAILQNLFFATLNTKQSNRRFTSKKKGYRGYSTDFGNHNVYRYEEEFNNSEEVIEKYFLPIPFLNGGLFDCLDYKSKTKDERKYIDGFTSTKSKQPVVPNFLFFADEKSADLNKDYGTTNKKYTVRGLIKTLSLYNFTIDENDPNDADVALDPELLGKVFENLLASYNPETAKTARKSTGSYYTPRPIVDYMVDESLKQYFKTHLGADNIPVVGEGNNSIVAVNIEGKDVINTQIESRDALDTLFSDEEGNPFDEGTTEKLVSLIDSLRAVDPAVGSGAFPMRLLNRLVFLLHKLDPDNKLWKKSQIDGIKKSVKDPILQRKFIEQIEKKFTEKNPDYGRKLYLIEKCIYGVDIQQIAVEIAKLRFFISLLVDEKIDFDKPNENYGIEPLPNLDFKLMQGNSLISSFAGIDFNTKTDKKDNLFTFDDRYKKLIEEFEELKSQYQNEPDIEAKRNLKDEIDKKLLAIFEEKLNQHFPQLKEINERAATIKNEAQRKEYIEKEKKNLFKKIGIDLEQAEKDLIAYSEGRKQKNFFLWDVYFAEVFTEKGGFDVVIGNPPYLESRSSDFNNNLKEKLQKSLFVSWGADSKLITRGSDLLIYFYEKAIKLIADDGSIVLITQNSWLDTDYGKSFQEFLMKHTEVKKIIDSDFKHFDSKFGPNINTVITVFSKNKTSVGNKIEFINFKTINDFYNTPSSVKIYSYEDSLIKQYKWGMVLKSEGYLLEILKKLSNRGKRIDELENVSLTFGQGLNLPKEYFVTKEYLADNNLLDYSIPIMTSDDGAPFVLNKTSKFLLTKKFKLKTVKEINYNVFDEKSTSKKPPLLILPRGIGRHFCAYNNINSFSSSFVELYIDKGELAKIDILRLWLFFNSSLFWLLREISGRKNLGGGMLKSEATDLRLFPVYFNFNATDKILRLFNALSNRDALSTIEEMNTEHHLLIDDIVFNYLNIDIEIQEAIRASLKQHIIIRSLKSKS